MSLQDSRDAFNRGASKESLEEFVTNTVALKTFLLREIVSDDIHFGWSQNRQQHSNGYGYV